MTVTNATSSLSASDASYSVSSSSDTTSTADTAAASQDRFLKLLVAQLSNQDPMNPMDNAQMTSQIAQINTVTGIQQLNETVKSMAAQAAAVQMIQASGMVGHGVLTEGNKLAFDKDGATAIGAIELAAPATAVKVQVMTEGGQVIDTVQLGALEAGQQGFSLDAKAYPSDVPLQFKVTATNSGTEVKTTALMHDTVVAVGNNAQGLTLTLLRAGVTPYTGIRSVL